MQPPSTNQPTPKREIVVYESGAGVRLEVWTDGETMWLTQDQMCLLFGRERSVITKHIRNVFKEGELPKEGFVQILHKTSPSGLNYLVRQLAAPPPDSPRRKIGFDPNATRRRPPVA